MRHQKVVPLIFCALVACGDDVSLGAKGGAPEGGAADSGAADDGGICTAEAGAALDLPCGNVSCNGESQYCSSSTWPGPCKPLPCECASAPPSAQSCACLLKYITPDCDAGASATCANNQSGLVIDCN